MQNRWQKRANWDWAEEWASLFDSILPQHVCEAAMATCRFQLRGLNSHGNTYGKGFLTFMQTFGSVPVGLVNDVQIRSNWIELDAHDSANLILGCFGLSVDDVYDHYGTPEEGTRIDLDLCELVQAIAPDFATTTVETAAVA